MSTDILKKLASCMKNAPCLTMKNPNVVSFLTYLYAVTKVLENEGHTSDAELLRILRRDWELGNATSFLPVLNILIEHWDVLRQHFVCYRLLEATMRMQPVRNERHRECVEVMSKVQAELASLGVEGRA